MAGMDSILAALQYHRPHISYVDEETSLRVHGLRDCGLGAWRNCTKEAPVVDVEQRQALGDALESFMEVGWPKGRKDAAWLAKADLSRTALTNFWDSVGLLTRDRESKAGRAQEEIDYHVGLTRFAHEEKYAQQPAAERVAILSSSQPSAESTVPPWSTQRFGGDRPGRFRQTPEDSDRIRRQNSAVIQGLENGLGTLTVTDVSSKLLPATPEPASRLPVNGNSLHLFHSKFGTSGDTKGTFQWQQIFAAMVDAGCSAYCNGGSAVSFKRDVGRIVFHRPHPEPTVDLVMLRVMGKRLTKHFGWTKDAFVEKNQLAT